MGAASPCEAQRASAAAYGVASSSSHVFALQRAAAFGADSGETAPDRGAHALVGAVIGATLGLAVGTAVDYELNRKTLNDPSAEKITVHPFGFLLPPLGAIIGAVVGWHS